MKKLLIILMLISPFSFADWGDVYYCQETTRSETTIEGKRTDYTLEKFTFKLDSTKNAMVFGKSGFLSNYEMELEENSFPTQELFWGNSSIGKSFFKEGKFLLSTIGTNIISISADCDKF